jgi:hypothetical protein
MPVILRDVPPTYHWGWYSRENQRMHLQVVDRRHCSLRHKVWLESKGRRVFEPAAPIPARIRQRLEAEVRRQRHRIEAEWVAFMIANGWLTFRLDGLAITLTAYPKSPNRFHRSVDLKKLIPNASVAQKVTPDVIGLNEEFAWLEIFTNRPEGRRITEPLAPVLWQD